MSTDPSLFIREALRFTNQCTVCIVLQRSGIGIHIPQAHGVDGGQHVQAGAGFDRLGQGAVLLQLRLHEGGDLRGGEGGHGDLPAGGDGALLPGGDGGGILPVGALHLPLQQADGQSAFVL